LFSNDLYEFDRRNDVRLTGHSWWSVFTKEGYENSPALPLLVVFWFAFFSIVFRNSIHSFITRILPSLKVGEMELDEGLPNYFATLDDHDRNWSVKEEMNCREVLKMKILNDETLLKL